MILMKCNIIIIIIIFNIFLPILCKKKEDSSNEILNNSFQEHIRVKRRFGGLRIFMRLGRLGIRGARRGGRLFRGGQGGGNMFGNNMYGYNNNGFNNYGSLNNWG
uniref:Uncharacterized protein n=1 Tax=Strongyloides stercoralis TaxID=6248 RepID=A0A0K0E9A2_STRER